MSGPQKGVAPDFTLPELNGSSRLSLSEINRDHPVLLVFWASWCPSCVDEIPQLNDWHQRLKGQFRIYGINVGESAPDIEAFMKDQPIQYPVLLDLDSRTAESYGLTGLPAAVLLAKGGRILYYGFSLPPDPGALLFEETPR